MVRRSLRAAAALLPILATAATAGEPALIVSDDKRRLEISQLSLDYRNGEIRAQITSARGGTVDAKGTWRTGLLHLELTGRDLAAEEADPWMLRAGPLPEASGRLDAEATVHWEPGKPVRIDASLTQESGVIDWVGLQFRAPIRSEGVILIGGGTVLQDLNTRAAATRFGDLDFTDVSCVVQLEDKQLGLQDLRAQGYGVLWKGEIAVDFREEAQPFRVALEVKDALEDQSYEFTAADGAEVVRIRDIEGGFRVSGRWTGDDTWRDTLRGSGLLTLQRGEVLGSPILPAIWNGLTGRVPLVKLPRLPPFLDEPNEVTEGRMSFEVREAAIHTEDLYLETHDFVATGAGHLGLDESIDADLDVALTQAGVARMFTVVALPLPSSKVRLGRIPVHVTGNWSNPEASADVGRVPLSMIKMIFGYALLP